MRVKIAVSIEDQGMRPYMEDRAVMKHTENFDVFGVFDGHGGAEVAQYLQDNYVQKLLEQSKGEFVTEHVEMLFLSVHKTLDEEIANKFSKGVGSTSVVVVVGEEKVVCANVGDSMAMIGNLRKPPLMLTAEHKVMHDAQRIRSLGGAITHAPNDTPRINSMLNLSRSFGDFHLKPLVAVNPYVSIVRRTSNDYIFIASDGVWDVFNQYELHQFIRTEIFGPYPSQSQEDKPVFLKLKLQALIQQARLRGSTDNIKVIFVMF